MITKVLYYKDIITILYINMLKNLNKKRRHRSIKTEGEHSFLKIVDGINDKIKNMKDNDYIKFRNYKTKLLDNLSEELKRKHFKDRTQYKLLNENKIVFMYKVFFYPKELVKIYLKRDNYKYILKTFTKDGIIILNKIMSAINSCIVKRTYDPIDLNGIYNKENFDKALIVLDIEIEEKIKFTQIRKKYLEKKEFAGGNMEMKEQFNKAFILLRSQYASYLKNVLLPNFPVMQKIDTKMDTIDEKDSSSNDETM